MDARGLPQHIAPEMLDRLKVAEHLCPVFQPLFDRHLRVMTYEALMRVIDADGQILSLPHYVEQMEAHGLISLADITMVNQVRDVTNCVRLHSVAVNTSLKTLEHRLPTYVAALSRLRAADIDVIVEITETTPIFDTGRLRACVDGLRAEGFAVALDDAKFDHAFGHPELLHAVNPDIVKIDGPYFHDALRDDATRRHLEGFVDAAHAIGATVVFEWVDTPERFEHALAMGADWVQGFLFGRPKSLWPSSLRREGPRRPCGHAHCPLERAEAQIEDQTEDQPLAPTRWGNRLSSGARKIDSSCGDRNSVKNGQRPPSAS